MPMARSNWIASLLLAVAGLAFPFRGTVAEDPALLEQRAMQAAVQRMDASVVQIQTVGGLEAVDGQLANQAPTSGIVVSADGYILSSAINFSQQPASILVRLSGGQQYPARIVARDQLRMLVLLKIDSPDPLRVPEIAPSDEVQVGQWALAVGRSVELDHLNVSVGIVSATNRIWGRAIQTDAKVSPWNYGGPLIDIQGRVIGILVPLSPDSDSVAAGAEWYDSGIGFAVPLSDLMPDQLARMQRGEDLKPGLLGVHLKGQNIYTDPAIVGFCSAKSPAREAGLAAEDEIVQVDDQPISRQVHLRHAMGKKMAGDTVDLRVRRGDQTKSYTVTLTDKIDPYQLPFFGVLPSRSGELTEVVVDFVYPGSPAAAAGLAVNDRLLQLDQQTLQGSDAWRNALAQHEPGQSLVVQWRRGNKTLSHDVTLSAPPREVPGDVPSRPATKEATESGSWTEIRLADEPHPCPIWVPAALDRPNGLLVWLLPAGKLDKAAVAKVWESHCRARGFLLALPRPRNDAAWEFGESETIRRLMESIVLQYRIDPHRVTMGGYQQGGTLAAACAFSNRERVRGVVLVDAAIPRRVQPRGNDPESRLEFLQVRFSKSASGPGMQRDRELLRSMQFPLVELDHDSEPEPPGPPLAEAIVRWADTLDRL